MEDGLIRPKSLKSKLGIGENTIRKRLAAMSQNEVFKLEVVPLTDMFEYEAQATVGININHQFPHRVIDAIIEHPAVVLAAVTIGRFNLVIVTRFSNIKLLYHFITTELPSIQGISYTETYLHIKRFKYHNIKWPIP